VKTEGCRDRGIREGERGGEENRRMVDGYWRWVESTRAGVSNSFHGGPSVCCF
jgi:hypothetical protein